MSTRSVLSLILALLFCSPAALSGKDQILQKHYGLIFGTAYGPDDRPLYGAKIQIHPAGKKHPDWELYSDHRGEFAQRVPAGPADYLVTGETRLESPETHKNKRVTAEAKVHIEQEERQDVSLHFKPQ